MTRASWWHRWRRARTLERRPIPDDLWRLTLARFPFLTRRSDADRSQLRELVTLFLASKQFAGAGGLHVTDEIAVAVASQACLPVLRLGLEWYDGFVGIVMHPNAVVATRETADESGVVHRFDVELSGEAMSGGPVMLAWSDVRDAGDLAEWGYNVVVHEFAHVLDMRAGLTAGADTGTRNGRHSGWLNALEDEYELFCAAIEDDEETFLDPYGADSIEEFFAVATEAFFVAAGDLRLDQPALYELLRQLYKQDTATTPGNA